MSFKANAVFSACMLVTSTNPLDASDAPAQVRSLPCGQDAYTAFFNDAKRQAIIDEMIHAPLPKDALAKPYNPALHNVVVSMDSAYAIPLEKLQAKRAKDPRAAVAFTLNKQKYAVPLTDINRLAEDYQRQLSIIAPTMQNDFRLTHNESHGTASQYIKIDNASLLLFSVSDLRRLDKRTARAVLMHELGHFYDKPNPQNLNNVAQRNEFRADSFAARHTSPSIVEQAHCQKAKLLYDDPAKYRFEVVKRDAISETYMGFKTSAQRPHPPYGLRIEYMRMMILYDNKKACNLQPPRSQNYTPIFKP